VVAEAAAAAGMHLAGFLDDDPGAVLASGPGAVPWLGPLLAIHRAVAAGGFIISLGDLRARRELIHAAAPFQDAAAAVIHPRAWVSPSAAIAPGAFIGPGALVHTRAAIAQHAIINTGAIVEHECHIGENTHIAPGATLGGRVRVGSDALVGLGARVLPNLRLGRGCTIAAGAVVTRDVPDSATVRGVPARVTNSR
jgi:sugar O-acyltransferase (sialic acid O-acetyltransferase NeuD family)